MLKKLHQRNGLSIGLFLGLVSLTSLVLPSIPSANATSAYDDALQTTPNLSLTADWSGWLECPAEDISTTWHKYLTDESTLYSTSGSNISNFQLNKASFENALDHGVWGITKGVVASGSNHVQYIDIWWKENSSVTLDWSIANGADQIVRVNGGGIHHQVVQQRANYGTSGGNPCDLVVVPFTSTESSFEISNQYGSDLTTSAPRTPQAVYFANVPGYNIDYPNDYEGDSVPYLYQGATISGNVQCANTDNIISNVFINTQSSVDGNAILADDGIGGKNYRFYLWNEVPYSLVVLCDGDPFYSPTVESNLYDSYNWACTQTTPGQNPNLNICAAS